MAETAAISPIDATGSADVTAELQALIDRTPNGGVVLLQAGGRYRVEGTLLVVDRQRLTIDGNGARLFATTTGGEDRSHLRVMGGTELVVRDLEIIGANPHAGLDDRAYQEDLVVQHGVRLEGVTDVELSDLRISDVYGDFVYVGRRDDGQWSQGVWIHDSVLQRSGRQGIAVTAGRDVVIERNEITDTRRATIDLEPNGPAWGAENVHILDNRIGPGRLLFLAAAGGGPVSEVVVARNELRGHALSVIVLPPDGDRRANFWVLDNRSDTPATRSAIRFTRVDGVVVTGNRQPITRPGEAVVAAIDVCGLHVRDNDARPGSIELDAHGAVCGDGPAPQPPAPPAVAGRLAAGPPAETTSTAAPPDQRPVTNSDGPEVEDGDGSALQEPIVVLGGVVAAAIVVGAVALIVSDLRTGPRARRRRRRRLRTR
ncbi:MAG: right-handed parallel beta-helix repeat-containing protein [Acidimicrobiales bacterium]